MDEQFLRDLHETLIHLYDPDLLRRSPLSARMSATNLMDASARLQDLLIKAIEGLKPKPGVPSQSRSWRIYDLLNLCYLQQFSQDAAANQLGISSRHLRRERRAALETLAYFLLEQYPEDFEKLEIHEEGRMHLQDDESITTINQELSWIKDLLPEAPADFRKALSDVLVLIKPLAEQYKVRLVVEELNALPGIPLHPVVLNQVLLDLISTVIHWAPGGNVIVSAAGTDQEIKVVAASSPYSTGLPRVSDEKTRLNLLSQLASLCGCRVNAFEEGNRAMVEIFLPATEQLPVLVIDDNTETLQLFSRYAEGTRYRLIGVHGLEEAMRLVEEFSPRMILLDVMMPKEDGWHILGQLRNNPLTFQIPVMICTILSQEDLAFSLGASGFLRKPVTRPDFLAALDRQVEQLERGSHSTT